MQPTAPTVTLCMIVRNVGRYIDRALRSVVPFVDEVIIVDTGSDDDTKQVIDAAMRGQQRARLQLLDFNPTTHPQSFLLDVAETWNGEVPGPFTGRQMLSDFGGARNFGWKQATSDYVMWLDSDDVLEHGENLAGILTEMVVDKVDFALINYDYSTDGQGRVNLRLRRERIVRRNFGAYWMQPVHEVLVPMGHGRPYDIERLNVAHKRQEYGDTHGVAHRNLKILYKWLAQNRSNPNLDPRMLFYLGMEERFIWPDKAIAHFLDYCARSGWDEERGVAHIHCALLHERGGRLPEAYAEFSQGFMEFPWNPEGIFGAARIAYLKQDWPKVIEYTERAFIVRDAKDPPRRPSIMWNPLDFEFRPLIYYSAALVNTGQFERARDVCLAGLKIADDPFLKGNLEVAERNIKAQQEAAQNPAAELRGKIPINFRRDVPFDAPPAEVPTDIAVAFAIQALWRRALDEGPGKALSFLDSLPLNLATHAKVRGAREYTLGKLGAPAAPAAPAPALAAPPAVEIPWATSSPPAPPAPAAPAPLAHVEVAPGKLDILCWNGPGWEEWNPRDAMARGLGGSELAAIYLMRELAKRGHRVVVNGNPGTAAGVFDGVEYIRFDDIARNQQHLRPDVLIVSRAPQAFLNGYEAKSNFLWVHDIHCGDPIGPVMEGMMRADRIFCLSQWHKGYFLEQYPFLHPDTVIVTRNGIDTSLYTKEPVKQGKRLIWTSTPHRGLDHMMNLLTEIRKEVPGTELHVYYGFTTWERIARHHNDQNSLAQISHLKNRIATTPGVVFHDRVGQRELADAFLASSVWAYPTWFTETSCITAMEAQAAGCVPVTTALAALNETVKHGILLQPPNTSPEYIRAFVSSVVNLLRNEPERRALASMGRGHALTSFGWAQVAADWEAVFYKTIAARAANPIGSFGNL
jgi:glycosyltransferase involved in cell wall biosynthesis